MKLGKEDGSSTRKNSAEKTGTQTHQFLDSIFLEAELHFLFASSSESLQIFKINSVFSFLKDWRDSAPCNNRFSCLQLESKYIQQSGFFYIYFSPSLHSSLRVAWLSFSFCILNLKYEFTGVTLPLEKSLSILIEKEAKTKGNAC